MQRIFRHIILLLMLPLLVAVACSHGGHNPRLERVDSLASANPRASIAALDSIAADSLSSSDRTIYDLLSIKTHDKAYINHTSDSLILSVIARLRHSDPTHRLPEALYYGGRVYSDLGDYPTALDYFHQALDALPDSTTNLSLRSAILSQTGWLLMRMHLYEPSAKYARKVLAINKALNDSLNYIYDLQLLGDIYLRDNNLDDARKPIRKSLILCGDSLPKVASKAKMLLAATFYKSNDIDSALYYIRKSFENIRPISRNTAAAYALRIYLKAGITDTALLYAREILNDPQQRNHHIAYQALLSPQLRKFIAPDTLDSYLDNYRTLLEDYYDDTRSQQIADSYNIYNYSTQEKARIEAEQKKNVMQRFLYISLIFLLIAGVGILLLYLRLNKRKLVVATGKAHIADATSNLIISTKKEDIENIDYSYDIRSSILTLRAELENVAETGVNQPVLTPIKESAIFKQLQKLADEKEHISDNTIFDRLHALIESTSPTFFATLNLLCNQSLTKADMEIVLLCRCGLKPIKLCSLLAKSNGAIISRRESLGKKIFGHKVPVRYTDTAILYL